MVEQLIEIEGVDQLIRGLDEAGQVLVTRAASDALTTTAFDVQRETKKTMGRVFEDPNPFTLSAFNVGKASFKKRPIEAEVFVNSAAGRDRTPYLTFQVFGGVRGPGDYASTQIGPLLPNAVKLNKFGNFPQGPKRYLGRSSSRRREFVGIPRGHPDAPFGVYRRVGRGGREKLSLLAVFRDKARYAANKLPFFEIADKVFDDEFIGLFEKNFDKEFRNSRNWK